MEILTVEDSLFLWIDFEPWGEKLWTSFNKHIEPVKYLALKVERVYKKQEFMEFMNENSSTIQNYKIFIVIYNTHTIDKIKDEFETIQFLSRVARKKNHHVKQVIFIKEGQKTPSTFEKISEVKSTSELIKWVEEKITPKGKKRSSTLTLTSTPSPTEEHKEEKKADSVRSSSVFSSVLNAGSSLAKLGTTVSSSFSIQPAQRRSTISEKHIFETEKTKDPLTSATSGTTSATTSVPMKISQKPPKFLSSNESLRALGCLSNDDIKDRQEKGLAILAGEAAYFSIDVLSAKNLLLLDNTTIDTYVYIEHTSRFFSSVKFRTRVFNNSTNPNWEESFDIFVEENPQVVKLTVYARRLLGLDQELGRLHLEITPDFLIRGEKTFPLEKVSYVHPDPGEITLRLHLKVLGLMTSLVTDFSNMEEALKKRSKYLSDIEMKQKKEYKSLAQFPEIIEIFTGKRMPQNDLPEEEIKKRAMGEIPLIKTGEIGILIVDVHGAKSLPSTDPVHCQIVVESPVVGTKKVKTRAIADTKAPIWDQKFVFAITDDVQQIVFNLNEQKLGGYEKIGTLEIPMNGAMLEGFDGLFIASHERTDIEVPGFLNLSVQLFIEKGHIQDQLKEYLKLKMPERKPVSQVKLLSLQRPKQTGLSDSEIQERQNNNIILYPNELGEVEVTVFEAKSLIHPQEDDVRRPKSHKSYIDSETDEVPQVEKSFDTFVSLNTFSQTFGEQIFKTTIKHSLKGDIVWKSKFNFDIDDQTESITFTLIDVKSNLEYIIGRVNINLKTSMLTGVDEWYAVRLNYDPIQKIHEFAPNQTPRIHLRIQINPKNNESLSSLLSLNERLFNIENNVRSGSYDVPRYQRGEWKSYLDIVSLDRSTMTKITEERKKLVLGGDLSEQMSELQRDKPKVFKLFLCSSYTDFGLEIDGLIRDVLPYIQRLCAKFGYQVQLVSPYDRNKMELLEVEPLLQQLSLSLQQSSGTSVISLISERLGQFVRHQTICQEDFQELLKVLKTIEESSSFESLYENDLSTKPPKYHIIVPQNGYSESYSKKSIQNINYDNLTKKLLSHFPSTSNLKKYILPTLSLVLNNIILNSTKEVLEKTITYRRKFSEIPNIPQIKERFSDSDSKEINETLLSLKDSIIPDTYSAHELSSLYKEYKVNFENPPDPQQVVDVKNSFSESLINASHYFVESICIELCKNFLKKISKQNLSQRDFLFDEVICHHMLFKSILENNTPKDEYQERTNLKTIKSKQIEDVVSYIQDVGDKSAPLFIYSESPERNRLATALCASSAKEKCPNDNVIVRFVGSSYRSLNYRNLLCDLILTISKLYEIQVVSIPGELEFVALLLKNVIQAVRKPQKPLIIFIDGIDKLRSNKDAHVDLNWIPIILPIGVKLIISLEISQKYDIYLNAIFGTDSFVSFEIDQSNEQQLEYFTYYLRNKKNVVLEKDYQSIIDSHMNGDIKYSSDWFDVTATHISLFWRTKLPKERLVLYPSVNEMVDILFDNLEMKHGKMFTKRTTSYICCSNFGLSDLELEDLLSVDDVLLQDIFGYYIPTIRRIPPLLWKRLYYDIESIISTQLLGSSALMNFISSSVSLTLYKRYIRDKTYSSSIHSVMASYFSDKYVNGKEFYNKEIMRNILAERYVNPQPLFTDTGAPVFNERRIGELPFHLAHSQQVTQLFQLLTSPKFLYGAFRTSLYSHFLHSFSFCDLTEFSQQKKLLEIIKENSYIYVRDPERILEGGWLKGLLGEVARNNLSQMKNTLGGGLMSMFESSGGPSTETDVEADDDELTIVQEQNYEDVLLSVNKLSSEKQKMILKTFILSLNSEEKTKVVLPFIWDLGEEGRNRCMEFLKEQIDHEGEEEEGEGEGEGEEESKETNNDK